MDQPQHVFHAYGPAHLTVIFLTIALPLVVIGGIFGMNFSRMPLTHDPWGFYIALGTMAAVSIVIVGWLHRNRWL